MVGRWAGLCEPRGKRGVQFAHEFVRGIPIDTAVGDADTVAEFFLRHGEGLAAAAEVALDHGTHDRGVARGDLREEIAHDVVGEEFHAAIGVVHQDDLLRAQQPLRDRERADLVVGDALLAQARDKARVSVSLHEYTGTLHNSLDADGKRELITMLWQVAWANGRVDKYEEHLLRRLVDLLHIPMADYIRAREAAAPTRSEAGA